MTNTAIDTLFPSDTTIGVLKAPNVIYAPEKLPFHLHLVASRKKDGVRCLIIDGVVYSAQMKHFRNRNLPDLLESAIERSRTNRITYDMELCDPTGAHHAIVAGALNSHSDPLRHLVAYVFDSCTSSDFRANCACCPYSVRIPDYMSECSVLNRIDRRRTGRSTFDTVFEFYIPLEQIPVADAAEVRAIYEMFLKEGDEGAIIRATEIQDGPRGLIGGYYKHGRATFGQSIIFKMKPFETADGIITDVIERMTQDTPRRPTGMVGAFEVTYSYKGSIPYTCHIGFAKGFDHAARMAIWKTRHELLGKWCEFTHMAYGAKLDGGLRHGRFVRLRPDKEGTSIDKESLQCKKR